MNMRHTEMYALIYSITHNFYDILKNIKRKILLHTPFHYNLIQLNFLNGKIAVL